MSGKRQLLPVGMASRPRRRKWLSRGITSQLALLTLMTALSGVGNSAIAAPLTLRLAWYMPPGTAVARQGEAIADNIRQLGGDAIRVQTYPSGSLLKASNIGEGIANNTVNMGIMAIHWWSSRDPAMEWDAIPFLVNDADELLDKLHGDLGRDINASFRPHGVKTIGWGFYGYSQSYLNNRHPIRVPSDLNGLSLRSEGNLSAAFLASQGATPVAVDSSEVYTAMQRGTLDGGVSGLSSIISRRWYEVGKYLTAIHYAPLVYPVMVNLDWWQGLTDHQRDIISMAVQRTETDAVANIEREFRAGIETARQNGNRVYRPDKQALAKWRQATTQRAIDDYLKEAGEEGRNILSHFDAGTDLPSQREDDQQ